MVEPGLTSRLRQHSRRSGMLVGLSMAITIIICIAAFIWIYIRVGPFLSDFIPAKSSATAPVTQGIAATPAATPTTQAVSNTPTPVVTPTPTWQATHRIVGDQSIYFRSGPTTNSQPVTVLAPGTQLQFLGDQQQTGGTIWMHFMLEDGKSGWIRQIDVASISP